MVNYIKYKCNDSNSLEAIEIAEFQLPFFMSHVVRQVELITCCSGGSIEPDLYFAKCLSCMTLVDHFLSMLEFHFKYGIGDAAQGTDSLAVEWYRIF